MAKIAPFALKEKAFGSITASYTAIGTALSSSPRVLFIRNQTDATLYISFDGTNDHHKLASNAGVAVDCATNKADTENISLIENGLTLRVKHAGSAPTSGEVVVEGYS